MNSGLLMQAMKIQTPRFWIRSYAFPNFFIELQRDCWSSEQGNRVIIYAVPMQYIGTRRSLMSLIIFIEVSIWKDPYSTEIWNEGCFILYETSSSEWFIAVPESESREKSSWDQSPENDLRKVPENRMVLSKLHGWSTCVNWGGILRIQEGYIGGLHSWSSRGC